MVCPYLNEPVAAGAQPWRDSPVDRCGRRMQVVAVPSGIACLRSRARSRRELTVPRLVAGRTMYGRRGGS
eukprot:358375-Chlamydomonas_euryale.AAC.1